MHRLVSVLAAFMLVSLFPTFAHAFCVYNQTDTVQAVQEWSGDKTGHGMSVTINPGQNSCCNWKDGDCNATGTQSATLGFITSSQPSYEHANVFCGVPPQESTLGKLIGSYPGQVWTMSAGGWANIVMGPQGLRDSGVQAAAAKPGVPAKPAGPSFVMPNHQPAPVSSASQLGRNPFYAPPKPAAPGQPAAPASAVYLVNTFDAGGQQQTTFACS